MFKARRCFSRAQSTTQCTLAGALQSVDHYILCRHTAASPCFRHWRHGHAKYCNSRRDRERQCATLKNPMPLTRKETIYGVHRLLYTQSKSVQQVCVQSPLVDAKFVVITRGNLDSYSPLLTRTRAWHGRRSASHSQTASCARPCSLCSFSRDLSEEGLRDRTRNLADE